MNDDLYTRPWWLKLLDFVFIVIATFLFLGLAAVYINAVKQVPDPYYYNFLIGFGNGLMFYWAMTRVIKVFMVIEFIAIMKARLKMRFLVWRLRMTNRAAERRGYMTVRETTADGTERENFYEL